MSFLGQRKMFLFLFLFFSFKKRRKGGRDNEFRPDTIQAHFMIEIIYSKDKYMSNTDYFMTLTFGD